MTVSVCLYVCVRLLSGGAASVGSPVLWPWAASHFYQPAGRRLYHAGLSVVGLHQSHTHTQVLPWSTCQGEFWSYTGFLLPSLPPNLPCFTSHPNSLVAMTTMPTAFFCLSSLGRTPRAGHPADYIVGLLKFVCEGECVFLPLSVSVCVWVLVQVCAVSLMMCVWCVSYLHSCHPSQTGVCQRAPVKQITILTAPLRLCSVSLSLSLFHL